MSLFAKMKTDATMKRHLKKAKAVVPNQQTRNEDFPEEDGDYNFVWTKLRDWEKDAISYVVFEFMCTDDGEAEGFVMSIMIKFEASAMMTVEDKMEQFFETLKLLGVDVESMSDSELEKETQVCAGERRAIIGSVTSSGKYKNLRIKEYLGTSGVVPEAEEEVTEEATKEWEEELNQSGEIAAITNPNAEEAPSDWEGYYGLYQDKKFWIANADDEERTVDLTDDDSVVVLTAVSWDDVVPSED